MWKACLNQLVDIETSGIEMKTLVVTYEYIGENTMQKRNRDLSRNEKETSRRRGKLREGLPYTLTVYIEEKYRSSENTIISKKWRRRRGGETHPWEKSEKMSCLREAKWRMKKKKWRKYQKKNKYWKCRRSSEIWRNKYPQKMSKQRREG